MATMLTQRGRRQALPNLLVVGVAAASVVLLFGTFTGGFQAWVPPVESNRVSAAHRQLRFGGMRPEACSELHEEPTAFRQFAAVASAVVLTLFVGIAGVSARETSQDTATKKLMMGGASTGDLGSKKNITRGVVLDEANYSNAKLGKISFQQSQVRNANFTNANLVGASFFDANLTASNFTNADMSNSNLELTRMYNCILDGAILTGSYINGASQMTPKSIDGADFSDVILRKDQQMYLCKIAKGVNPVTKVDTKESLMCDQLPFLKGGIVPGA